MKFLLLSLTLSLAISASIVAEDWPTYRYDNQRSGVVESKLGLPMEPSWKHVSPNPPKTAWARPALWDAYSGNEGLQAMRNFDGAFYVTTSDGLVYFASSLDDAVHCLDAETGKERWVAFAGAPVRLPPTIYNGLAYFGADDGFAYCVDAKTGEQRWKVRAAPNERMIPSDGRLISPWPVRTGVLVQNGTAYFGASLLPWRESILWGVDATTGKVEGEGRFKETHGSSTYQGILLSKGSQLMVPQGRLGVLKFNSNGKSAGQFSKAGGVHCSIVTAGDEEFLLSGPNNQKGNTDVYMASGLKDGNLACNVSKAVFGVASNGIVYTNNGRKLAAVDVKQRADLQRRAELLKRKAAKGITPEEKAEYKAIPSKIAKTVQWEVDSAPAFDMIIVGDHIVVGSAGKVVVYLADLGEEIWEANVEGNALGLAYANGRLYVSTDLGHIFTFTSL